MSQVQDLTGRRFGRLTVVRQIGSRSGHALWECQCECGGTKVTERGNLIRGFTSSCGCYQREWGIKQLDKFNQMRKEDCSLVPQAPPG
jgi:hypothetical protein